MITVKAEVCTPELEDEGVRVDVLDAPDVVDGHEVRK